MMYLGDNMKIETGINAEKNIETLCSSMYVGDYSRSILDNGYYVSGNKLYKQPEKNAAPILYNFEYDCSN